MEPDSPLECTAQAQLSFLICLLGGEMREVSQASNSVRQSCGSSRDGPPEYRHWCDVGTRIRRTPPAQTLPNNLEVPTRLSGSTTLGNSRFVNGLIR